MSEPLFVWANEPSVGLLLTHGDNGELIVQIVKSSGGPLHDPIATATLEPYRQMRVCNFIADSDEMPAVVHDSLLREARDFLEIAEFKDSENAVCALDVRERIAIALGEWNAKKGES